MGAIRRLPAVVVCALVLAAPASAAAEDAPFVPIADLFPALPGAFEPTVFDDCAEGSPDCVERTLDEMYRRYGELVASCNHNAVFALTYIRVTEEYVRAAARGFFEEPEFLAHEDAVFARLYFEAWDTWIAGRLDDVSMAWRVAFRAGRDRTLPAIGNVLLGINAHVNRDMPFMLAGLGLVKPDGTTRKRDHDHFNQLLNAVYDDVIPEVARRFDPSADEFDDRSTTLDNLVTFQILPLWREGVWRHAEMLARARTPTQRKLAAAQIESYALSQAQLVRQTLAYRSELGQSSAGRDAHCSAHAGTAAQARAEGG